MVIQTNSDDSRSLRKVIPLSSFPVEAFNELCTNTTVEQVQDQPIFKRGDTKTELVYLLSGSVTLQAEGLVVEIISSDSESAKFALAHQIPRKIDAIANGVARIVRLDADKVNNPPPVVYQENIGYTIDEELGDDSDDWMAALLHLPLFQNLPPSHLQKILMSLKTSSFAKDATILDKGAVVDYFYLINKGQCLLTRKVFDEIQEIKLNVGDSFGEEYLLLDKPAQEQVTALTDVGIIQLEKKHFLSQIKEPLVQMISHDALPEALANGAVLLDVRLPHQFESQSLNDSANIPLMSLRMRLSEIPSDKQVIVVCANGKASQAAAFLLCKHQLNALVLEGGMGIDEPDDETQPESEPLATDFESQLEKLTIDNEKLKRHNLDLEAKITQLQTEKNQAIDKVQILTQQLDRLKEILSRLTKTK